MYQSKDRNGAYHYTSLATGLPGNLVRFLVKVEAQCGVSFRLNDADVRLGAGNFEYDTEPLIPTPDEVCDPASPSCFEQDVPVNTDHRTIPWTHVDFDVPINLVEDLLFSLAGTGFLQAGEAHVAQQMANGKTELEVCTQLFTKSYDVPVSADVDCCRYAFGNGIHSVGEDTLVPLLVPYHPHPVMSGLSVPTPALDRQIDPQFMDRVSVTQAVLFALPLPARETCGLSLSAVFTTNAETLIQYRIVNELGIWSQIFDVLVDHTFTAFVDHDVDLWSETSDTDGQGFVAPTLGDDL